MLFNAPIQVSAEDVVGAEPRQLEKLVVFERQALHVEQAGFPFAKSWAEQIKHALLALKVYVQGDVELGWHPQPFG